MMSKFAKVTLVLACAFLMSSTLPGCACKKKCGGCPGAAASKCGKDCTKPCCKKACAPGCTKSCCKKA